MSSTVTTSQSNSTPLGYAGTQNFHQGRAICNIDWALRKYFPHATLLLTLTFRSLPNILTTLAVCQAVVSTPGSETVCWTVGLPSGATFLCYRYRQVEVWRAGQCCSRLTWLFPSAAHSLRHYGHIISVMSLVSPPLCQVAPSGGVARAGNTSRQPR